MEVNTKIIERIDEVLMSLEDWVKGEDGDNITECRGLLQQLEEQKEWEENALFLDKQLLQETEIRQKYQRENKDLKSQLEKVEKSQIDLIQWIAFELQSWTGPNLSIEDAESMYKEWKSTQTKDTRENRGVTKSR